ncbi:MAG: hypothetical protein IT285_01995 [Bdellovibrionales bacterium]|nr:hypothetical protein [Bdellovibrionales bacterium]
MTLIRPMAALTLFALCAAPAAQALDPVKAAKIRADLQAFRSDPASFMNRHPEKTLANGQSAPITTLFGIEAVDARAFITARDQGRKQFCTERDGVPVCLGEVQPGKAPFGADDRAEDLVDRPESMITRLRDMDGLRSARLPVSPWSDDYWPIYKGQIGNRYADESFPESESWKRNADYVAQKSALQILAGANSSSVDTLSPAEKYDLLVGDRDLSFTESNWAPGRQYFTQYGKVETWMGLCHGWAPAAFMLERPTNAVTVLAADGQTRLNFYPSDIKALATSLWANVRTPSRFVGGRCNDKDPAQDENGRNTSGECFDTNPGTWHQVVVQQIARSKRSFVMDATFDYEVWNQPVVAYEYAYFNPKTDVETESLEEATVSVSEFTNDVFRKYRSESARRIVGVAMEVTYVVENSPNHAMSNKEDDDDLRSVTYYYDLELDSQGRIVGGEWYGNEHPDFLWLPPAGTKARAYADRFAEGGWSGAETMNSSWRTAARTGSRRGQPLGKIVETLIGLSRAGL